MATCFVGGLENVSAKSTVTGTVRFTDSSGADDDSYHIGERMYFEIDAGVATTACMYKCWLYDGAGVLRWYAACTEVQWTDTASLLLSDSYNLGEWELILKYTSNGRTYKTLDTDTADVLEAVLPDLIMDDIWTIPTTPIAKQPATIYGKVRNQGLGAATSSFSNYLYADGGQIAEQTLSDLAAGTTGSSWSSTMTLSAGYHILSATADVLESISESVETNNERSENIWWASPDLEVDSIEVFDDTTNYPLNSVYSGWPIYITVRVSNNGDATAAASMLVIQDILGGVTTSLGALSFPALEPSEYAYATLWYTYLSSPGAHTLRAVADSNGNIWEANMDTGYGIGTGETNNNYDKAFVVNLSDWTVAIYMDADEYLLEDTLEDQAFDDIAEMQLAGGTLYGSLNIIVMIDMFDGEVSGSGQVYSSGAMVYIILAGWWFEIADLGEVNMGDPLTLHDFVTTYSLGRFKASQSMLVLWDHGGGCIGGMFTDEHIPVGGADNMMKVPEMGDALDNVGIQINILAMHACLMSSLEVGYEMYEISQCDIIVGFEDVASPDGFPYGCSSSYTDGIFNYMRQNPSASAATVAYEMVDRTYRSYQSGGSQDAADDNDQYLSVAAYYNYQGAPGNFHDIAHEVSDVGYLTFGYAAWAEAAAARVNADYFAPYMNPPVAYSGYYVDAYDYIYKLKQQADFSGDLETLSNNCAQALDEIEGAFILKRSGSEHGGYYGGISLFFPASEDDWTNNEGIYAALSMSILLDWNVFLQTYTWP
ncbi:MAG: hypothetical protein IH630_00890 [Thermoplasmata archaeon]|nr:hypothetical protein [Thermoplasmata archaeon]